MAKRNSKKPDKVTKKKANKLRGNFAKLLAPGLHSLFVKFNFPPFSRGATPWTGIVGSSQASPRVYPGGVVDVNEYTDLDWITIKEMAKPLPPGVPLDEDIVDVILQHWSWLEQFKIQVQEGTATESVVEDVSEHFGKQIQLLYMEALWRQLTKKRSGQK